MNTTEIVVTCMFHRIYRRTKKMHAFFPFLLKCIGNLKLGTSLGEGLCHRFIYKQYELCNTLKYYFSPAVRN